MLGALRHSDETPDILIRQALANGGVNSPLRYLFLLFLLYYSGLCIYVGVFRMYSPIWTIIIIITTISISFAKGYV